MSDVRRRRARAHLGVRRNRSRPDQGAAPDLRPRATTRSGTPTRPATIPRSTRPSTRLLAQNGTLSDADLETIYTTYISPSRLGDKIDNVGVRVMDEIDQVMAMIDAAVGSASKLQRKPEPTSPTSSATPRTATGCAPSSRAWCATANEMKQNNEALEQRLNASKEEITQLQENLAVVRTESLTDPLTGLVQPQAFRRAAGAGDRGSGRAQRGAVAGDDRHRSFQGVQRHLGPSHRRPGAAAGRACR